MFVLVILQNLTDSENVQSLRTEMCPASTLDVYQAISIKAEALSDAEEEDPLARTFPRIKDEPGISCVSGSMVGGLHRYR
jgi:hypothetical protein